MSTKKTTAKKAAKAAKTQAKALPVHNSLRNDSRATRFRKW